jgi:uncharacterized lipoprotein YajG
MLKRTLFLAAAVGGLEGCVSRTVDLTYEAKSAASRPNVTVAVEVEDRRPFILDGDKDPDYLGHERSPAAIPFDVTTKSGLALADTMQQDLMEELDALGFRTDADSPSRSLLVAIQDFNFDLYIIKGRFWYELDVAVFDQNTQRLASSEVSGQTSLQRGDYEAKRTEIPQLYRMILKAIVRENDEIMSALVGSSEEAAESQ